MSQPCPSPALLPTRATCLPSSAAAACAPAGGTSGVDRSVPPPPGWPGPYRTPPPPGWPGPYQAPPALSPPVAPSATACSVDRSVAQAASEQHAHFLTQLRRASKHCFLSELVLLLKQHLLAATPAVLRQLTLQRRQLELLNGWNLTARWDQPEEVHALQESMCEIVQHAWSGGLEGRDCPERPSQELREAVLALLALLLLLRSSPPCLLQHHDEQLLLPLPEELCAQVLSYVSLKDLLGAPLCVSRQWHQQILGCRSCRSLDASSVTSSVSNAAASALSAIVSSFSSTNAASSRPLSSSPRLKKRKLLAALSSCCPGAGETGGASPMVSWLSHRACVELPTLPPSSAQAKALFRKLHGLSRADMRTWEAVSAASDDMVRYLVRPDVCASSLRSLELGGCEQVSDVALEAVGKSCSQLEEIGLSNVTKITDKGLRALAMGCPALSAIDLCGCYQVTDLGIHYLAVRCRRLTQLILDRCKRIGDAALLLLAQYCPQLRSLHVQHCHRISPETLLMLRARGVTDLRH
eukprot:g6203.t1